MRKSRSPTTTAEAVTPGQTLEADDMDMAWLENLAAKQGIPDDEMTTSAEQRAEVTEADAPAIELPEDLELPETLKEQPTPERPSGDTDWLKQIGLADSEDHLDQPDDEVGDSTAAWLDAIQEEGSGKPDTGSDDTVARFLAAKQGIGDQPSAYSLDDEQPEEDWLAEAIQQPHKPAINEDEDKISTDWLKAIGQEAAEEAAEQAGETPENEPSGGLSPVDEEEDDLDMDWLSQIGDEAAAEAAEEPLAVIPGEETADDDWLTELDAPVEEAPVSPVDEEGDDLDMDWLSQIGDEAAAEATGKPYTPPTIKLDENDDWATDLDAPKEESLSSPVDEEGDDLDMDWLSQIGDEAAEEAAEEPLPETPAPTEETNQQDSAPIETNHEPVEESANDAWLSTLETLQESQSGATDWLANLKAKEAAEAAAADPLTGLSPDETEAPSGPIDEDDDDFDMDWLDEISEQASQEAVGEETPKPISPVDAEEDDFDMDWLDEISEEAAAEAATEAAEEPDAGQPPAQEDIPALPVDGAEDDFDEDWLDSIGEETAQETAAPVEEIETSFEKPAPVEEFPDEGVEEPEKDDWFDKLEAEDELEHGEAISDTDAWLLSMGEDTNPPQEEQIEPVADSDEWLSSLGIQPDEDEHQPEPAPQFEAESEISLEPPAAAGESIQPTHAEEWKPESAIQPETTAPEPKPDPLTGQLAAARQAIQENDLDTALKGFGAIIKKGKFIEEIIEDLNQALIRHPINAKLWQALGDAYLRMDNLQDALDAYSKAEDMLR